MKRNHYYLFFSRNPAQVPAFHLICLLSFDVLAISRRCNLFLLSNNSPFHHVSNDFFPLTMADVDVFDNVSFFLFSEFAILV